MQDSELTAEIRSQLARLRHIRELPPNEAKAVHDDVSTAFVADTKALWWWTSLRVSCVAKSYGSSNGIELVRAIVPSKDLVRLAITDDEHGPWPVLEAQFADLATLLSECRFFEYFVVDRHCEWIVFDTHDNTVVVAGTLKDEAERVFAEGEER